MFVAMTIDAGVFGYGEMDQEEEVEGLSTLWLGFWR